jgi:hypothetical protein
MGSRKGSPHNAAAMVASSNGDPVVLELLERDLATANRRSIPARWALHVIKACLAEDDLKTLADWAKEAGVSYTSLRETCYLLNIRPHDARDFARVLRAVLRSSSNGWDPARFLDIADRRTMSALLGKSGLGDPNGSQSLIDQFFEGQSFIDHANAGVLQLAALLKGAVEFESRTNAAGLR